jgi:hypothetical protein
MMFAQPSSRRLSSAISLIAQAPNKTSLKIAFGSFQSNLQLLRDLSTRALRSTSGGDFSRRYNLSAAAQFINSLIPSWARYLSSLAKQGPFAGNGR